MKNLRQEIVDLIKIGSYGKALTLVAFVGMVAYGMSRGVHSWSVWKHHQTQPQAWDITLFCIALVAVGGFYVYRKLGGCKNK
jgi:hypothetical protein